MNTKRKWLAGLFVLIGLSQSILASEIVFQSTQELVEYGIRHNAQLQSKHALWKAALEQPNALGSLPDPMVGVRLNGSPSKTDGASFDQKRYVASQSFPFFGELSHLNQLGKGKAESAYLAYLQEKNQLTLSILRTVYSYYLNEELISITNKNKAVLDNLINIADVKYQAGLGLQANVLKAKVAKDKFEEELLSLSHQKTVILESLKQLLNVSTASITLQSTYPNKQSLAFDTAIDRWVNDTLTVKQAKAMLTISNSKLIVEKDRYLPNFSAQIEYWDNAAMDNQYGGQIMMTVPWFNSKNSASVDEAKHQKQASVASLEDMKSKVRAGLTTLVSEIQTTDKTLQLYDDSLLKHARLALSNFQKAFEVDKASFIDYFEAEQTVFQLEKHYAMQKNRYFTALATLTWQFEKGELPDEQ
jgi:cobalt-zinc-cadmium efflux system outer membrane protein